MKCCVKCGKSLEDEMQFCVYCGAKSAIVDEYAVHNTPNRSLAEVNKTKGIRKKQKLIIGLLIAVIAILVILPVLTLCNNDNQSDSLDDKSNINEEFIFADSDTRYISQTEVEELSEWECLVARNEIYARHGRIFENENLKRHFSQCSWYEPKISAKDFSEDILNDYEKENVSIIYNFELKMGYVEDVVQNVSVEELYYNCNKYVDKKVRTIGILDAAGTDLWIWNFDQTCLVLLKGMFADEASGIVSDWMNCTVEGRLYIDETGEVTIDITSIE